MHFGTIFIISMGLVQQTLANEDSRPEMLSFDSDSNSESHDYDYANDFGSLTSGRENGATCLGTFHYGANRGLT